MFLPIEARKLCAKNRGNKNIKAYKILGDKKSIVAFAGYTRMNKGSMEAHMLSTLAIPTSLALFYVFYSVGCLSCVCGLIESAILWIPLVNTQRGECL